MPDPITVNITAVDDPDQADKLNVSVNLDLVLLSFEDLDEIRWVCNRGTAQVDFAPANNPFDPNASTGGHYEMAVGGSGLSGSVAEIVLDNNSSVFRQFKYTITVIDGTRTGVLDPRVRVRRDKVYKAGL